MFQSRIIVIVGSKYEGRFNNGSNFTFLKFNFLMKHAYTESCKWQKNQKKGSFVS